MEKQSFAPSPVGGAADSASLFSFKVVKEPIFPVEESFVDASVYALLFLLFIVSAANIFFGRRFKGIVRKGLQVASASVFLLFFHQCLCIMRDWAFGFQLMGKDNVAAFGNLFLPFALIAYTSFLGRVFCGYVCPMGFILETAGWIDRLKRRILPDNRARRVFDFVCVLLLIGLSIAATVRIMPDNRFFYESTATIWTFMLLGFMLFYVWNREGWDAETRPRMFSLALWIPLIFFGVYVNNPWCSVYASNLEYASLLAFFAVILASMVVEMSWCRLVCPLGAFLSIFAARPLFRRVPREEELRRGGVCFVAAIGAGVENGYDPSSCFHCTKCLSRDQGFLFSPPDRIPVEPAPSGPLERSP